MTLLQPNLDCDIYSTKQFTRLKNSEAAIVF
jgi:hypothetical protein